MEPTSNLVVGARCEIQGKLGTIRFVGHITFATGKWVGVELDEPLGKNNGSIADERYFDCKQNHGIFVRPSQIKIIDLINSLQSQQYNVEHPHNQADDADMKETKQSKHPLEFLFGTWYGEGNGKFEGICDFVYNEEITINPDEANRGWLYYRQRTWNPMKNNSNFHSEVGYIRTPGMSEKIELVLAQPTGIASIEEGRIDGTTVMLKSTDISRSTTAKPPHVAEYNRTWTVDPTNESMTCVFNMSTQSKQMARHLYSTLRRIGRMPK